MNGAAPYLIVAGTFGCSFFVLLLLGMLRAAKNSDELLGYDEASEPQPASIDRALVHYQQAYAEALEEARVKLAERHHRIVPVPPLEASEELVAEVLDEAEAITYEGAL